MENTALLKNEFLTLTLKAYFQNDKTFFENSINFNNVSEAIDMLLLHFINEDRIKKYNHLEIIQKIYSDNTITGKNCNFKLGICNKTFYRYKKMYLQIFKSYLIKCLNSESYIKIPL